MGTPGTPNPYNLSKKYCSTPPICTAVRPPFVTPCLAGSKLWKGNAAIHLRFALQYASYLYRTTPPICTGNTFENIPVVGGSGKFLILAPLNRSVWNCNVFNIQTQLNHKRQRFVNPSIWVSPMKIISVTPTPHIRKKDPPEWCHKMRVAWRKKKKKNLK